MGKLLEPCLYWTKRINQGGYGQLKIKGRTLSAHRVAYQEAYGAIPDGMCVCHHCDNRPCVEPTHLFLGTIAENNADMMRKGRHVHGAAHPASKLTETQVLAIRDDDRPHRVIASAHGISRGYVWKIKQRIKWRHL